MSDLSKFMEINTFEECEGDELTQVWSVHRTRMLAKLGDSVESRDCES